MTFLEYLASENGSITIMTVASMAFGAIILIYMFKHL